MPPEVTIVFVRSTQEIATSFCVSEVAKETVQDWTLAVSANTIKYHVRLIVRNTPTRSNTRVTGFMIRPRTILWPILAKLPFAAVYEKRSQAFVSSTAGDRA